MKIREILEELEQKLVVDPGCKELDTLNNSEIKRFVRVCQDIENICGYILENQS